MRRIHAFIVAICVAFLPPPAFADDPRSKQAYLGLSARDSADGPIVGWISVGPLGGTGFSSRAGILRGDNIVSLNGVAIESAAGFNRMIEGMAPGATVDLVLRRSPEATPRSAVPKGGPGGDERTFTVELSDRLTWSGTIGVGLLAGGRDREIGEAAEGEFEAMILRHAEELGVRDADGGLRALKAHLWDVQQRSLDPNALPAVVKMFQRPLSLDAVEQEIADLVLSAGFESAAAVAPRDAWPWTLIAGVLDLPEIADEAMRGGGGVHAEELALMAALAREWRPAAEQLVRTMRRGVYLHDEHAKQSLAVIRESPRLVAEILPVVAREGRKRWGAMDAMIAEMRGRAPMNDPPDEVRDAVEGKIVHAEHIDGPAGGWLVVGGEGPNVYDMSKIAFVIDLGGDDVYRYGRAERIAQVVIDLGGDDLHESLADFSGAATGIFGVSILDSRGGSDVFRTGGDEAERGTHFTIGAGLFGIGVLVNRAGDNRYLNLGPESGWSTGVGFYGAGLVVDLDGDDTYHAELLSQGVGGPRGFGAIIDVRGDDSYKANGPNFTSVYGTEGVFVSRSQGFGYGVRSYAAGGVGAIYDLDGEDRYEAGEFGQAGGYYFGLGIIRDRRGNDVYIGNRYGQAFAAHQAGGILIDEEGDDVYESMTAASQSGAWDQCVTMLIDRSGNDRYKADGLAQGAAAMQAIAILIDLDGDDVYEGRGHAVQGHGSNNTYHHHTAGVFSFSALFDLGGGEDVYSSGRQNNTREATGQMREDDPGQSTVYGVFVDE